MSLTRYFRKTPIEVRKLRGVRDVLAHSFNWSISNSSYDLFFPSEKFTIEGTDALEEVVKDRGEPHSFVARYKSGGGSKLTIDTTDSNRVVMEASPVKDRPSKVLDSIGSVLGLILNDSVPTGLPLDSAFIAHSFDENGRNCASELARFLELIEMTVHSGRTFAPKSVAEKVQERLTKYDLIFAIITPHEDHTWINQEMGAAKSLGRPLFVLKQDGIDFKPALLGDLEYIPFPAGSICWAFVPILEGLKELRAQSKNL